MNKLPLKTYTVYRHVVQNCTVEATSETNAISRAPTEGDWDIIEYNDPDYAEEWQ
jgi:hypothetical protein